MGDPNKHLINLAFLCPYSQHLVFSLSNSLIEVEKMQSVTYSPQTQLARGIDENSQNLKETGYTLIILDAAQLNSVLFTNNK